MYLEFTTEQFAKLYPDKWNAFPLHMKLDCKYVLMADGFIHDDVYIKMASMQVLKT